MVKLGAKYPVPGTINSKDPKSENEIENLLMVQVQLNIFDGCNGVMTSVGRDVTGESRDYLY